MVEKVIESSILGGKKLERKRMLEDAGLPKGRVKSAINNYNIAKDYYKKIPQAIIKITSYLKGISKPYDHLIYISRHGEIDIETETGEIINNIDDMKDIIDEYSVDFTRKKEIKTEKIKISIINNKENDTEQVYKDAKKYSKEYLNEYNFRIDKGTYKSNKNNIYITLSKKNNGKELSSLDELNDRFTLLFTDNTIEVSMKEKRFDRDIVNIILSAPEKTNPDSLKIAVRNTLKEYFCDKGYRYNFALHDPKTDIETKKNPHIHVSIKMFNELTGKKLVLNPKNILELRTLYASKAKDQGIIMSVSRGYQQGKNSKSISLKELKLTESEKIKSINLRKNKKLKSDIASIKKHINNPIYKELKKYRVKFNTIEEFILESKRIKNLSFKENNNIKKTNLMQLYRALDKEVERLSKSKMHNLNEKMRDTYKEDAKILKEYSEKITDPIHKNKFENMSKVLNRFSNDVPKPISNRERFINLHLNDKDKSEKELSGASSKELSEALRDDKEIDDGLEM